MTIIERPSVYYVWLFFWVVLTFFMLLARLYLRVYLRYSTTAFRSLSSYDIKILLSDFLVVVAWFAFVTYTIVGQKRDELFYRRPGSVSLYDSDSSYTEFILHLVHTFFYYFILQIVKLALLLFCLEVVPIDAIKTKWVFRISIYVMLVSLVYNFSEFFLWCRPISSQWEPGPDGEICKVGVILAGDKEIDISFWIQYGPHCLSDIIVGFFPIFLLRPLWKRLKLSQKIACTIMIALGFISLVCSVCIMTYYIASYFGFRSYGITWGFISDLEVATAVAVICFPAFKTVVSKGCRNMFKRKKSDMESQQDEEKVGDEIEAYCKDPFRDSADYS